MSFSKSVDFMSRVDASLRRLRRLHGAKMTTIMVYPEYDPTALMTVAWLERPFAGRIPVAELQVKDRSDSELDEILTGLLGLPEKVDEPGPEDVTDRADGQTIAFDPTALRERHAQIFSLIDKIGARLCRGIGIYDYRLSAMASMPRTLEGVQPPLTDMAAVLSSLDQLAAHFDPLEGEATGRPAAPPHAAA